MAEYIDVVGGSDRTYVIAADNVSARKDDGSLIPIVVSGLLGGSIPSVSQAALGTSYLARDHLPQIVWVPEINWYAASNGTLWKRLDANTQVGVTDPLAEPGVWSPNNISPTLVLTNGGRTLAWASSSFGASGGRSYVGHTTGKWTFEVVADISTGDSFQIGFSNAAFDTSISTSNQTIAGSANAIGWAATNVKANGVTLSAMPQINTGDIVQGAVDLDADLFWLRKAGGNWNNSASADPVTGVGGLSLATLGTGLVYVATTLYNSANSKITSRFKESQMSVQLDGFDSWSP